MWFRGVKVKPFEMMETADGLSQMLAGFIRKQGIHVSQCRDAGEEDIAARLREVTRQAEELARLLASRMEEVGSKPFPLGDLNDLKARFLLLVLRANGLVAQSMSLCHGSRSIAAD